MEPLYPVALRTHSPKVKYSGAYFIGDSLRGDYSATYYGQTEDITWNLKISDANQPEDLDIRFLTWTSPSQPSQIGWEGTGYQISPDEIVGGWTFPGDANHFDCMVFEDVGKSTMKAKSCTWAEGKSSVDMEKEILTKK